MALLIEVQLFVTSNGRVHAGSLHPSEVKFTVGGVGGAAGASLEYDLKTRRLSICGGKTTYQRSITATRQLCPYDTIWTIRERDRKEGAAAADGAAACLPATLSVINTSGRVAAFRGTKPDDPGSSSSRAADLLGRVPTRTARCRRTGDATEPSSSSSIPIWSDLRARRALTLFALLLAILTEGWWSQGAISHGTLDDASDSHGGEVDQTVLLREQDRPHPRLAPSNRAALSSSIIRPAKSLLRGYQRHLRRKAKGRDGFDKENENATELSHVMIQ